MCHFGESNNGSPNHCQPDTVIVIFHPSYRYNCRLGENQNSPSIGKLGGREKDSAQKAELIIIERFQRSELHKEMYRSRNSRATVITNLIKIKFRREGILKIEVLRLKRNGKRRDKHSGQDLKSSTSVS